MAATRSEALWSSADMVGAGVEAWVSSASKTESRSNGRNWSGRLACG
jgi:hypothetical protein